MIANRTTTVAAAKSVNEIQTMLASAGWEEYWPRRLCAGPVVFRKRIVSATAAEV